MELNTVHKKIKNKKKLNTHLLGGKTIGIHYDLVHQEYRIISHDLNFLLISFSRIDMFKIIIGLFLFFNSNSKFSFKLASQHTGIFF